jgi:hypothetical protein
MMGRDPGADQNENTPRHEEEPSLNGGGHRDQEGSDPGGSLPVSDAPAVTADDGNQAARLAALSSETDIVALGVQSVTGAESVGTGDLLGDNDLLGALTSMPSAGASNIDHALDQLTSSTDLFDVPALDFHDDLPT